MSFKKPLNISKIAHKLNVPEKFFIGYGDYVAKIDGQILNEIKSHKGKLVLVTAITPTPLGEGKTVNTIGITQGLNYIGENAIACIRQPSLGPVFGVKGGAAGGGQSEVVPTESLNLHLTGDIHAITAAHNLASAAIDARLFHETKLGENFTEKTGLARLNIDEQQIVWKRVIDHNDRALRNVTVGVGGGANGITRNDGFEISAASELMAILALADDLFDMRKRIGKVILAYDKQGNPITAEHLEVAGAMTVLLKQAIHPNLMQTTDGSPALIHAGPFANIAHGNSSVIADKIALSLCDYVVTEAGFGSDMGMEKFFNIKHRQSGIKPSCVVVVATIRSLKTNSGAYDIMPGQAIPDVIYESNLDSLKTGANNLKWHINNASSYGVPVVVAINHFPTDSDEEIAFLKQYALEHGASACELSDAFIDGGNGASLIAKAVVECSKQEHSVTLPYDDTMSIKEKINAITKTYGAIKVNYSAKAEADIQRIEQLNLSHLPICIAKTPMSISADPKLKNCPTNFDVDIKNVGISAGAGFIRVYAGNVMTMPGLGTNPSYRKIDIDESGNTVGLS